MFVTLLKYLMTLTFGLIMGYLLFSSSPQERTLVVQNSEFEQPIRSDVLPRTALAKVKPQQKSDETTDAVSSNQWQNTIRSQQQKIVQLELALAQLNQRNQVNQAVLKPVASEQAIETVTMEDFEKKMQEQFLERFKGYAIELEGERLEDIKNQFDKDNMKAEWNAGYETSINTYIQDNDPNRLHFVDELSCNSNMCRLKVNSSEANDWKRLFLNMTQQSWYHSITLSEKSNDPNVFIYFITKPQVNR